MLPFVFYSDFYYVIIAVVYDFDRCTRERENYS